MMRKLIFFLAFIVITAAAGAQQLKQVTFSDGANLSWFSFLTNQNVLIRVSDDGKVLEWGTEVLADRGNYYHPKLQPFLARTEYYGPEADVSLQGKVKSIGTTMLNYYNSFEQDGKAGKLRSIGPVMIDYYNPFENEAYRGKIKFVGPILVEYHSSFENEAFRGKVKSIGSTRIEYYSNFDDKAIRGKIKSIGGVVYSWYTSFDRYGAGGLKAPLYRQNIGGLTYVVVR